MAPERILGLTFTNKAAASRPSESAQSSCSIPTMKDRGDPVTSTYHAFAGSLMLSTASGWVWSPTFVSSPMRRGSNVARAIEAMGKLDLAGTYVPTLDRRSHRLDPVVRTLVST